MSQSNDTTAQQLAELIETTFIFECIALALVALPAYEYLITIDQEVALVWSRKNRFSLQSMLLVSTRTVMILSAIFSVTVPARTCRGYMTVFALSEDCTGYIQTALFSALRVSALHDRSLAIFVVILALNLSPIATNLFRVVRSTYVQDLDENLCFQISGILDSFVRKLVLITRVPVIVADVLVLVLTWARTYQQVVRARRIGAAAPLSTCLARDGTVYFVILLFINALEIATLKTNLGAPVDIAVAVLPPILISRFMLNLRRAGDPTYSSSAEGRNTQVVSSVRFQLPEHVVGSMGEPLENNASGLGVIEEIEEIEEIEDVREGGSGNKEGDVVDIVPGAGAGSSAVSLRSAYSV